MDMYLMKLGSILEPSSFELGIPHSLSIMFINHPTSNRIYLSVIKNIISDKNKKKKRPCVMKWLNGLKFTMRLYKKSRNLMKHNLMKIIQGTI